MPKFLLLLLLAAVIAITGAACASKTPKSSARLYEGDSPSIRFTKEPETAGGRIYAY